MKYFINGRQVTAKQAWEYFVSYQQWFDISEARANWSACLRSEEARDEYLPSELELIPA